VIENHFEILVHEPMAASERVHYQECNYF